MDSYTVEYTVWIDVQATSRYHAIGQANDLLNTGDYSNASVNLVTNGDGHEVDHNENVLGVPQ